MGFLSNLLQREAKRAISQTVRQTMGHVVQKGVDTITNAIDDKVPSSTTENSRFPVSSAKRKASGESLLRSRLEQIIATEWSGYELKKNVAPEYLNAPENAKKYSYVMYQNNIPKAAFLIVTSTAHHIPSGARIAKNSADAQGIPCLYFMSHLPNEEDYISQRLKATIR